MKFAFDMVHHNPGGPPFVTAFTDPAHLARYGFNGQVFKHLNCIATFAATGLDLFPVGTPERAWLQQRTTAIESDIAAAKAAGLQVFYHLDLVVLPRKLVEHYRAEICDPQTGRISVAREKTLELHRLMFEELAARFPLVDGFVIRVGETYLWDTPYHIGNGPIPHTGPKWSADYLYDEVLRGEPVQPRWGEAQEAAYVRVLCFLREEVCARLGKYVVFRTWDIFPDKLHARLDHYLAISNQIEPHEKLLFSIKHTALDFWRHVKVNECLGRGRHPQVIEVQCQREYEGKGAYPNYLMHGLIEGFEEDPAQRGLREVVTSPLIQGIFSWSRGGGWYGPAISHELWPDLNMYVLGRFAREPAGSEASFFRDYAREILRLSEADAARFRELCLLSSRAILKGRYCAAFDQALHGELLPTANWMRDDRLGGITQLRPVLRHLQQNKKLDAALAEKKEAVGLWRKIEQLAAEIAWPQPGLQQFARVSASYGQLLFSIVLEGWCIMAAGVTAEATGVWDLAALHAALERYRENWDAYRGLAASPSCPSLYFGSYLYLQGEPPVEGMEHSIAQIAQAAEQHQARLPCPQV